MHVCMHACLRIHVHEDGWVERSERHRKIHTHKYTHTHNCMDPAGSPVCRDVAAGFILLRGLEFEQHAISGPEARASTCTPALLQEDPAAKAARAAAVGAEAAAFAQQASRHRPGVWGLGKRRSISLVLLSRALSPSTPMRRLDSYRDLSHFRALCTS